MIMLQRTVVQLLHFHPRGRRSMEVFQIALAEELLRQGWRTVHVVSGEPGEYFKSELQRLKSPYLVAKFPLTLREACRVGLRLRAFRPKIVHTAFLSSFSPSVFLVKKFSGASRLIVADHSSGATPPKRGLKRLLAKVRAAVVSTYVDQVVAVSDFIRNRDIHSVYLPAQKVRTILNGVEVERYPKAQPTRGDGPAVVGFVGQLITEKGVRTLLQAVKELAGPDVPPFKLLIAGQGAQEEELRRFCLDNALNCVQFLGQIDWVPELLASADIVVVPSEWEEAFGFTVAETMAAGACVIASDAGGIPEIVGTDGTAGVLFRKGDRAELKSKLLELLSDPSRRKRMGASARKRAEELFSLGRMVQDYSKLYAELDVSAQAGTRTPQVNPAEVASLR